MSCNSIKKTTKKICNADFDKKIKIQTSGIFGNNSRDNVTNISFNTIATPWAMIKTKTNSSYIDGVNVINGLNTLFYIRFDPAIDFTQQLWVEYNDNLFKIADIDNIDLDNETILLTATEKGSKLIPANQA